MTWAKSWQTPLRCAEHLVDRRRDGRRARRRTRTRGGCGASGRSPPRASRGRRAKLGAAYACAASDHGTSALGSAMRAARRPSCAGSSSSASRTASQASAAPRRGVGPIGDLDVAAHAHAQQRMRAVHAEMRDARCRTRRACRGARRAAARSRARARARCCHGSVARRQVRELPRLRDRRRDSVARLVLDAVAIARHPGAASAADDAHAASCSMLRGTACEKNLSEIASETA